MPIDGSSCEEFTFIRARQIAMGLPSGAFSRATMSRNGVTTGIRLTRDDRSYFDRTSSGSFSIRTKWVGTHWALVILYFSISRSASSGSNFSIITTVPPMDCSPMVQPRGAA